MKVYRVPAGIQAIPIVNNDIVALQLNGEKISQVAAFSRKQGAWTIQDLKQPVDGPVSPVVSQGVAVSRAGRFLCAFSAQTGIWDVADLGEAFSNSKFELYGPIVASD